MRLRRTKRAESLPEVDRLSPDEPVVTSTSVLERGEPVRYVARMYDDTWEFISATEEDDSEAVVLHASHLFAQDATLRSLVDLAPGTLAYRASDGYAWQFWTFATDEEYDIAGRNAQLPPVLLDWRIFGTE